MTLLIWGLLLIGSGSMILTFAIRRQRIHPHRADRLALTPAVIIGAANAIAGMTCLLLALVR